MVRQQHKTFCANFPFFQTVMFFGEFGGTHFSAALAAGINAHRSARDRNAAFILPSNKTPCPIAWGFA
jgi:hypothetical protein